MEKSAFPYQTCARHSLLKLRILPSSSLGGLFRPVVRYGLKDGTPQRAFELASTNALPSGIIINSYKTAVAFDEPIIRSNSTRFMMIVIPLSSLSQHSRRPADEDGRLSEAREEIQRAIAIDEEPAGTGIAGERANSRIVDNPETKPKNFRPHLVGHKIKRQPL